MVLSEMVGGTFSFCIFAMSNTITLIIVQEIHVIVVEEIHVICRLNHTHQTTINLIIMLTISLMTYQHIVDSSL